MTNSTSPTDHLTLVTGGTGKTGRRVADRLTAAGQRVRIGSRTADIPFSWEDDSTWEPAVAGVSSVYLSFQPDLAFPGATEAVVAVTELAKAAGAQRVALLSGRGEEAARAAEIAVQNVGLDTTIVRCAWFNQNFSESFFLDPVLHGELALPTGDCAEPFIDCDDIADVAAAALLDPKHAGQEYELTGPRLLTFHDVAKELSAATGREITYAPVSMDEFRVLLGQWGLPEDFADLFSIVLDGRNAHLSDGVQRALGREPRDFADYARAAAATGVWNAQP